MNNAPDPTLAILLKNSPDLIGSGKVALIDVNDSAINILRAGVDWEGIPSKLRHPLHGCWV